jgi:hypothetical protein
MGYTMRFPGGRAKALTLSYDDGVFEDYRLIDIMTRHGLKGTFNINGGLFGQAPAKAHRERLTVEQTLALYLPSGNELALHGFTHPHMEEEPQDHLIYEVVQDRISLESKTGTIVRGMAYPFGTTSEAVVSALRAAGVAYARNVTSTHRFDLPSDWLRMPATCHHNDSKLTALCDAFLTMNRRPMDPCQLFYLWGHSYEFSFGDTTWHIIEQFAEKMGGHEDIWYATNIEICDYVRAYGQLRTSVDGKIVYNPTATTLYFNYGSTPVVLAPGETKCF